MTVFDTQVSAHLASLPNQLTDMLTTRFREEAIVHLENLLPPELVEELHEQALRLISGSAQRRDLEMEATGGTPRHYLSVGRDTIHAEQGAITKFFESSVIREYLSQIAGETLHRVPYEPEEYIVNSQSQSGDTHGWHWDDYTFALIWVVEAPGCWDGGRVEYMANTQWDKERPRDQLEELLTQREIQSRYVPGGTCYLMRANTTLHRVAPLTGDSRRTVIVFTYASDSDLVDDTISHETMEQIYSAEIAA